MKKKRDVDAQAGAVVAEYGQSVDATQSLRDVLRILKCSKEGLHSAYRVGSRVYGCATAESDSDYLAVLNTRGGKSDLLFRPGINITVHTVDTFQTALDEHSIFALECLFAPPRAVLKQGPPFPFKLDKQKLIERVKKTSESDRQKARRLFEVEWEPSKKKLYHSIRVLLFAKQILSQGRIYDFGEANPVWASIRDNDSLEWADYEAAYKAPLL